MNDGEKQKINSEKVGKIERREVSPVLEQFLQLFNRKVFSTLPLLFTLSACEPKDREIHLGGTEIHVIQEGDTLHSLSKKYGVSAAELKKVNGIKNDTILKGARLKIPLGSKIVHGHEVTPHRQGQYVTKVGEDWFAVTEYEKEGKEEFESKNWEEHPRWDESLLGDGQKHFNSDHTGEPVTLKEVDWIILHSTISPKVESVSEDKKAHFVVDKKGTIYLLIDIRKEKPADGKAAPHAGESIWAEDNKINEHAIGIEVVATEGEEWNEAQNKAVKELVAWLGGYFELEKNAVLRHSQVAVFPAKKKETDPEGRGRKSDPIDKNLWENLGLPNNDLLLDLAVLEGNVPMSAEAIKRIQDPTEGLEAAVELKGKD